MYRFGWGYIDQATRSIDLASKTFDKSILTSKVCIGMIGTFRNPKRTRIQQGEGRHVCLLSGLSV